MSDSPGGQRGWVGQQGGARVPSTPPHPYPPGRNFGPGMGASMMSPMMGGFQQPYGYPPSPHQNGREREQRGERREERGREDRDRSYDSGRDRNYDSGRDRSYDSRDRNYRR